MKHTNCHRRLFGNTLFAKDAAHSLTKQSTLGYDAISLDWTVDPVKTREQVDPNITLQGNSDPQDMYKTPKKSAL
uniref:Uroporphyrinogen decarboxylase (URO-D) domain-containing protein n=1 Tax=Glossina morsitans morsitans TaxID=37546 RepID=A0A1B0GDI0_GLOMM